MKVGSIIAFIVGAFIGYSLLTAGVPFWLTAIIGGGLGGMLGALADIYFGSGATK
jgi:hypothetical protein